MKYTEKPILYRHKKTGRIYKFLSLAIECTNARSGDTVIIYVGMDDEKTMFVREQTEFNEKFELVESQ